MAFVVLLLLIIGSFIAYALWSAKRRVAAGGPLRHPDIVRGTTITNLTSGIVTLSDGCVYSVAINDISTWRVGQEVFYTSGQLMNGSELVPATFLHKTKSA